MSVKLNTASGGSVTLAPENTASNVTLTVPAVAGNVATEAYVGTQALGVGQTWQNVTASRAKNTTYTNSTGRPIFISVSISSNSVADLGFLINGVLVVNFYIPVTAANAVVPITYVIPAGATYGFNNNAATISSWFELR